MKMILTDRLRVLGAAITNLFTGKGVTLTSGIRATKRPEGYVAEFWQKPAGDDNWRHISVAFDYVSPAQGFVNGSLVPTKQEQ